VEMIAADISRTVDAGPDWVQIVEDAILRQDMEWLAAADRVDLAGAEELRGRPAVDLDLERLAGL
jgi:hypothetical protein